MSEWEPRSEPGGAPSFSGYQLGDLGFVTTREIDEAAPTTAELIASRQ